MFFVAVKLVGAAQDIPPTPRTTSYENCVHISTRELQSCTDLGNSHNFGENASKMPNSVHFMALATEQVSRSGLSFVMFTLELVFIFDLWASRALRNKAKHKRASPLRGFTPTSRGEARFSKKNFSVGRPGDGHFHY